MNRSNLFGLCFSRIASMCAGGLFAFVLIVTTRGEGQPSVGGSTGSTEFEPLPQISSGTTEAVSTNAPPMNWDKSGTNTAGQSDTPNFVAEFVSATNKLSKLSAREKAEQSRLRLEMGRYYRNTRRLSEATPILVGLLDDGIPEKNQKAALLELAAIAQEENELPRAQQVYAQFLNKWSEDQRVPEILLRQGQLFRQMGLNNLALTKFYAVMTSALVLKNDRLDYYAHIVLQAQIEIAETHYLLGKYPEAADFFSRLLKQNSPALNKPQILYKLLRCQSATTNYDGAIATGQDFLSRYQEASEEPEVRFYLAVALKQFGRNNESLQQVLILLREQSLHSQDRPEVWSYWQQRTGNIIANQLYGEGDFARALDIYMNLSLLDPSPSWQLPVAYQIGMTYERLWQPQKAIETYNTIISRESEVTTNSSPSLKAIIDMARWRVGFIQWQSKAEAANHDVHETNLTVTASLPTSKKISP